MAKSKNTQTNFLHFEYKTGTDVQRIITAIEDYGVSNREITEEQARKALSQIYKSTAKIDKIIYESKQIANEDPLTLNILLESMAISKATLKNIKLVSNYIKSL